MIPLENLADFLPSAPDPRYAATQFFSLSRELVVTTVKKIAEVYNADRHFKDRDYDIAFGLRPARHEPGCPGGPPEPGRQDADRRRQRGRLGRTGDVHLLGAALEPRPRCGAPEAGPDALSP